VSIIIIHARRPVDGWMGVQTLVIDRPGDRRRRTRDGRQKTTMVSPSATTVLANVGGMCMAGGAVYYAINVAKIFGGA